MERNLTTGSVWKTVVRFSLPFLLSYFLQTLYGLADLFIIGQFNGVEATTAVSNGSQVMHMCTVMIVGLAMGTTVMIGQAVGAKKNELASRAIGNTIVLFLCVSVALAVVLSIIVRPIVGVMSTPAEAVEGTISYLRICFIGIPLITAYNVISAVFRGMGDSRSPMYFIAVACVANIVLDYVFIGAMGMGPRGAAFGTVLGQTISVIVALIYVLVRKTGITMKRSDFRPRRETMGGLLKVGVPIALQDGFIQISFLIITIFANMRGLNDAAAIGVVEKIISIPFLIPSSMLATVSALSAQNVGAGLYDRAKKTLRYAIFIAVGWGILVTVVMEFSADWLVALFTSSKEVVRLGGQYLRGYVFDCIFAGIHFSCSGYFSGVGRSGLSFMHNVISILGVRIPFAYLASRMFASTLMPMGLATAAGSLLSVIICAILFVWLERKRKVHNQFRRD
ncbi:MAG: MATE family efflux transporter [Lachnospiraceae bacterium]|nr:MATE family efflux transporter [Lachnospiraceae bacterium]